jgi:nucleoside-diphosphate-sugar epimerase
LKILITGANGYLGSYITKKFIENNAEVTIVVRRSSNLDRISIVVKNINILYLEDEEFLVKIRKTKVDILINAIVDYGRESPYFFNLLETNVLLPFKILDLVCKEKGFIYFTFDSFYAKQEFLDKKIMPEYVLSKNQLNEWLDLYNKTTKVTIMVLRLEHLIGPNESINKFNGWILNQLISNIPVIKLTSCEQVRDFIYIEDVVDAIFILIKNRNKFEKKFNQIDIGTGLGYSIKTFVENLHHFTNSNSKLEFGALPSRVNEIKSSIANNEFLYSLGWKPEINLNKIIKKILEIL